MAIAIQQIQPVAHLPLVLGVLRRLEVATVVDGLLPVHSAHVLSCGRGVEAMVLAILDGHHALYKVGKLLLRIGQGLNLDRETRARLGWRRVGLGRTSPTGAARAAARCPDAIAERVIPPGARPAPAVARPPALIGGDGGLGIRRAGEPLRLYLPHVVGNGLGFLLLRPRIRLRMLLGQLTRMHHDKAHLFLHDPFITILDLHLPHDALPMPTAGRFRLGPPRFLYQ